MSKKQMTDIFIALGIAISLITFIQDKENLTLIGKADRSYSISSRLVLLIATIRKRDDQKID